MISVLSKEKIKDYYNFYYLENIKKIIQNEKIEYGFYNLEKINNFFSFDPVSFHRNIDYEKDLFLESFSQNKVLLAKNIIEIGTYWPFWGIKYNNKIFIVEGIHRIFSLQLLNKINKINKNFLCLILPISYSDYKKHNIKSQQKNNVPCDYFYLNNLSLIDKINLMDFYQIYENILIFGMKLSNLIFKTNNKYPNFIKPNPIFNDEELFKQFLKDESF